MARKKANPEEAAKKKAERFVRVTEARVNNVISALIALGKCAVKQSYLYTPEQVEHIFSALEKQLELTKALFYTPDGCDRKFSLEKAQEQTESSAKLVSGLPERVSIYDVRRGIAEGDIQLSDMDGSVVAVIGDHWFYFGGNECEGVTASVHIDTTRFEDDVQAIYEAINAEPINGATDEEATEALYYKAFLKERADDREKTAFTRQGGIKIQYPMEEQVSACYAYLNWTDKKDPWEMDEEELAAAVNELCDCEPGFVWVPKAGYAQLVPMDASNGKLILN